MAYSFEYPYTDPDRSNADWLLNSINEVLESIENLNDWKATHEREYNELKALYDAIISGNVPPSVAEGFRRWMRENAIELVAELVKNVFFGLNDNGYFVAYIPESWNDIIFNTTGLDISIGGYEYGRLVLSY